MTHSHSYFLTNTIKVTKFKAVETVNGQNLSNDQNKLLSFRVLGRVCMCANGWKVFWRRKAPVRRVGRLMVLRPRGEAWPCSGPTSPAVPHLTSANSLHFKHLHTTHAAVMAETLSPAKNTYQILTHTTDGKMNKSTNSKPEQKCPLESKGYFFLCPFAAWFLLGRHVETSHPPKFPSVPSFLACKPEGLNCPRRPRPFLSPCADRQTWLKKRRGMLLFL